MKLIDETIANLRHGWIDINHKAKSKGFDGQTIKDFRENLKINLEKIKEEVKSDTYKFTELKGVAINKPGQNDKRGLRIPAVRDRVLQKAILLTIEPTLTKKFNLYNPASFAYLKNDGDKKGVQAAVEAVRSFYLKGYKWVYIADISKFFDTVSIDKLLETVFDVLPDDSLNKLIDEALRLDIGNRRQLERANLDKYFPEEATGIPQGGILSPMFANVYLAPLDKAMIDAKFNMVRYADDFLVMCKNEQDSRKAYRIAKDVCKELELTLHELGTEKSDIKKFIDIDFLGVRFSRSKIYPGKKTTRKILTWLKNVRGMKRIEDINVLRKLSMKTQAWGSTYYYTDFDKKIHDDLDNLLFKSVDKILGLVGYKKFRKITTKDLEKMGIFTFTNRIDHFRSKKETKKIKTERIVL